jgi:hypothetical protein
MVWKEQPIYCDGCGVELSVGAITFRGKHYCCQDCLEGKPCQCGERMEVDEPRSNYANLMPS